MAAQGWLELESDPGMTSFFPHHIFTDRQFTLTKIIVFFFPTGVFLLLVEEFGMEYNLFEDNFAFFNSYMYLQLILLLLLISGVLGCLEKHFQQTRRRRPLKQKNCSRKAKEWINFSPNGLINNVLLLQKTSLRAFIRLQYDEKSLRNESCSLRSTSTQILESFQQY